MNSSLIIIAFLSGLVTFLTTPLVIMLARQWHMVDDERRVHPAHTHVGAIPRAGGLAIYMGIFTAMMLFVPISKAMIGVMAGASLLLLIGLLDDIHDVNPYLRFVVNILAALCVIAGGISIPYITNPFTGAVFHLDAWSISLPLIGINNFTPISYLLALLWIVWTMNIVGWSSGVDGQLPGFITIAALCLFALALRFIEQDPSQIIVMRLALATAGGYVGFLPWNFYPQKIMPGYSGKTLAGFMLATISILTQAKIGTAILVLGIPMIDALFTMGRRIWQKKSPVWPDRGHFHHRLLDMGWGKRRIAFFYWMISALLGVLALSITARGKLFVVVVIIVWIGGVITLARFFRQQGMTLQMPKGKRNPKR